MIRTISPRVWRASTMPVARPMAYQVRGAMATTSRSGPLTPRLSAPWLGLTTTRMFSDSDAMGAIRGNIRDFVVKDAYGNDVQMRDLVKRVTLIVNVDCKEGGSSNKECQDLEVLYDKYKDKGFQIIAFPSGQFQLISGQGSEIPASRVKEDLEHRYHVSFPVMDKVNVNGDSAHPLFMFLQKRLSGFPVNAIKWDFTKFLCVDGEPRKRYAPTKSPQQIEEDICEVLQAQASSDHHGHGHGMGGAM